MPEFLEHCRSDLLSIRTAMVTTDYEATGDLGRRLRGAGGGLGFEFVTEVGGEIEAAARRRDEPAIRGQMEILQSFLDHVQFVADQPAMTPRRRAIRLRLRRRLPIMWS
jgi:hypothetical protein